MLADLLTRVRSLKMVFKLIRCFMTLSTYGPHCLVPRHTCPVARDLVWQHAAQTPWQLLPYCDNTP